MGKGILATAMFVTLILAAAATSEAAAIIDFETVTPGTTVPFSVTTGGITASFSSDGEFRVSPFSEVGGTSANISGQALFNTDFSAEPVLVSFGSLLTSISLGFAIDVQNDTTPFTLTALLGGTTVGTTTVLGTLTPGFGFSGGTIGFSGLLFDNVVFSSGTTNFAVDDITFNSANAVVPEPGSMLLLGSALAALAARSRARRRRQS